MSPADEAMDSPNTRADEDEKPRLEQSKHTKKRNASRSPRREALETGGDTYKNLFGSDSEEEEEEGAVNEPQEISNDLDRQQEDFQATQRVRGRPTTGSHSPGHDGSPAREGGALHPRGYWPPEPSSGAELYLEQLIAPRGLIGGHTSKGAYERTLVQRNPLFTENIEVASPRIRVASMTQPQTSSNFQWRKAKTHAAMVNREAASTPEGLRTVEPQLVRLRPRCQITKGTPDLLKLAKNLIHIGRGCPATNPIMEFRDLPAQLVQAVFKLREDPAIPGLGSSITASPETQSDLEDKNTLTETINLRVLRLSHSRKRCNQPGGAPRRRCLVLEVERGLLHLSSTVMERPTTTWSGSSASGALMESASSW
ncbi:hypothetical protein PC118_g4823 [Phytophthora cactorum]|uniref:Uncharacterized protein n=3 Tax=Phytophthora cactorum TaxID=29920 RepID=A0A8T1GDV6_9STRA|nr:hypothetical protein PC114_g4059 [Phytophthora cactorum]KAG2991936.1 hypothetical protein PC118_g4823 [Phytophthora cactorum]KAG3033861.1 hypothetical protein PC119_g5165 [Phytophthora cactorum]KAG3079616.1 hypothetical protein PC122_g12144 [Phytophthora cactorum]KAG3156515.1 hypothetical protein PC128_g21862 [Phytophthora cactorum]